ncbi:NAD(P)H-dependent oxidoreductase [Pantoea cypripedii]|uniref:NAD(P)H-dependent oxidoreductase n=1 Tax=Pantoea cypripedii TaxID=55209 RepID=UPI002FCAFD5A
MKTLIIVSHPYQQQSNVIKALQQTAEAQNNVMVRNLEEIYGDNVTGFDIPLEQSFYAAAERVVFIFPIHWFNLTPMLKAYLNEVWAYGWAFGPDGVALKNKQLLVVASAGASEYTYSHQGLINSTFDEVMTPMKATALYCGMDYLSPLSFHSVIGASAEKISDYQEKLSQRLSA